jgi:ribosomal protein L40E
MPKRNLHIVNPSNPLFGICERCNARFASFAYNQEEADKQ